MATILKEIEFGKNVSEIISNEDCQVLKVQNETGEGIMTAYRIFPGAVLMYNDFHMAYCMSEFQANNQNLLCIDHCREGRIEQEMKEDTFYYLENGDLCVDMRRYHAGKVTFPQNHFHGLSVAFYLPEAEQELQKQFKDFSVCLGSVQEKFCKNNKPYVIKASMEIEHIFSELYRVPTKIKKDYFRIKVFELLLYLDALEIDNQREEKPYFYKDQVEKIKAVQKLITNHVDTDYTIEELALKFDLSQTTLKRGFKTIYGSPVYSYLQNYRMNIAAGQLKREKDKSVAEIAFEVGYENPSKFATTFKKVIGVTPLEYRKQGKEY